MRISQFSQRELVKRIPLAMSMPKPRKAARGKHRWVGIEFSNMSLSRSEVEAKLTEKLAAIEFRLFDCSNSSGSTLAIIKVALEDFDYARTSLEPEDGVESKTSSGKIRLVRERMGLPRPVRKR
tara:strand:+ start:2377 stop:2748 length:372 start_codon:yes stop_codon:yes gene_type:complete